MRPASWLVRLCSCSMLISLAWATSLFAQCRTQQVEIQQQGGRLTFSFTLQEPPADETYGPWQSLPDGVWWREYQYTAKGVRQRHYVIWKPEMPESCFCYNPVRKVYWGRWNYGGGQTTFSSAVTKAGAIDQAVFGSVDPPLAPQTSQLMTPPGIPSDLPGDIFRRLN